MTAIALASGLTLGLAVIVVSSVQPRADSGAPTPALPPVSAGELIKSVRSAQPGALAGTVRVDERLGLVQPGNGAVLARLWSDGAGRRRIALPGADGERTIVDDGRALWTWNSATRSVLYRPQRVAAANGPLDPFASGELLGNPATAASAVLAMVEAESTARVEPPAIVAGRPAYQLVLTPMPTERTLLREIRLAVDEQTRLPLEMSVLTNGSSTPALRVGFSELRFGPQDPALFRFTPASGVRVREPTAPAAGSDNQVTFVGRGWDTVLVRRMPPCPSAELPEGRGSPISGPWGHGQLVSTPIGTAVLTSDGRLVAGAVPAQVLTEALRS